LDDPLRAKPLIAFEFGLHTGSMVRWYLEGETEYYATLRILPRAAAGGIELVNLKGALGEERANAALRLADGLQQDQMVRRFSFISFDMDVSANVRAIRRQVEEENIVGHVNANNPDFEFTNFSLDELIEVAVRLDESCCAPGDQLRQSDWTGVSNGREFEKRYCSLSARKPRGLKGEEWGVALAEFAMDNPHLSGTKTNRPFLETVNFALRARRVRYENQRKNYKIDSVSFRVVKRS
jgi:hypothetical protein